MLLQYDRVLVCTGQIILRFSGDMTSSVWLESPSPRIRIWVAFQETHKKSKGPGPPAPYT